MPLEPERWTLLPGGARADDRMDVGELGWTLPRWFEREIDHNREPFSVWLHCQFQGERVEVRELRVRSRDSHSITPRGLSGVDLARVVYRLTESELHPEHARPSDRRPGRRPDTEELQLLAAIYAFEYAAWGNPRQAIMGFWSLPRATANRWIRRARELYPHVMPAGDGGEGAGEHSEAS